MLKLYFSRPIFSWALYDFANSAFATTILAVIFNVYFVKVICAGGVAIGDTLIPGESFWGYAVSFSMLIVFFLAPVLGAISDFSFSKKKFLLLFCALGSLFSGLLFFCTEGDYWTAALFFVIANIGFASGNIFYNSLLQDISTPEKMGRVSGFGWAVGYIGGGLLLAINLAIIEKPEWFFIPHENHLPVRFAILLVGAWWAIFSIPIFLWGREKSSPSSSPFQGEETYSIADYIKIGLKDVIQTFRTIREHKEIFKYLVAYLIYNDGIETVIIMAAIFGAKELAMSQGELTLCFLMIQGVAFFGSLLFGALADRLGHKSSISITLLVFMVICLWAVFMKTKMEFWILGAIVGTILGGSQAASRSFLALLVPPERSAQFFGFFALTGKLATVIGPFVFALLAQFYSLRSAVAGLILFFAAGLALLSFVKEPTPQEKVLI